MAKSYEDIVNKHNESLREESLKENSRLRTSKGKLRTAKAVETLKVDKGWISAMEAKCEHVFPTYLPSLDLFLPTDGKRRGFPAGKFCIISGEKNTYKSSVCYRTLIAAANEGANCYIIDVQKHFESFYLTSGMSGTFKDDEAAKRMHLRRLDTNQQIYEALRKILVTYKNVANDHAKALDMDLVDYYMPRDGKPVIILIDGVSGSTSETSFEKEDKEGGLGKRKVAEENVDWHRIIERTRQLREMLGITVLFSNNMRANINTGFSFGPNEKPWLWTTLKDEIDVAIDFRYTKMGRTKQKTVNGNKRKFILDEIICSNLRSCKWGSRNPRRNLPDIVFNRKHGFDLERTTLSTLEFLDLYRESGGYVFYEVSKTGVKMPEAMKDLVGKYTKKEFKEFRRTDKYRKALINGFYESIVDIPMPWVATGYGGGDDLIFGGENRSEEDDDDDDESDVDASSNSSDKEELEDEFEKAVDAEGGPAAEEEKVKRLERAAELERKNEKP